MLVPKKNRLAVYTYLFKEGLIVAPKNITIDHSEIQVPNLQVVKLMLSLKSRGFVKENFAWAHHYFYVTDEGIEYLRTYLNLPAEIVPATLKKQAIPTRPAGSRQDEEGKDQGPSGEKPMFRGNREGGREGYRREGAGAPRAARP